LKIFNEEIFKEIFEFSQYTKKIKINDNDTVLDLGCSWGYLYFKCISEGLTVNYIGVDGSVFNFKNFIENLSEYPKLIEPILLNLAIDDELRVIDFKCMFNEESHQLVPTITFPDLLKLINKPIDFLKFDIEGYEKCIFEDLELFKSKVNRFAGEIHLNTEIFPRNDVYESLLKLSRDTEISLTLFSVDMIDITSMMWENADYYNEIIINGMVIK
jgi:hypothetical protein